MLLGTRLGIFGATTVVALATLAIYLSNSGKDMEGLQCGWRPDFSAQYQIDVSSVGQLSEGLLSGVPSGAPRQVSMRYGADLEIKSHRHNNRSNTYSAAFLSVRGMDDQSQNLRDELLKPFSFQMDADCRFSEFGFTADDSRESREIKKNLLVTMETVAKKSDKKRNSWQAEQTDSSGTFMADYRFDFEKRQLSRKKLYYSKVADLVPNVPLKIQVQLSEGTADVAADFWLRKLNLQEKVRIVTASDQIFLKSETNLNMELKDPKDWLTSSLSSPKGVLSWEGVQVARESTLENSSYEASVPSNAKTLGEAMANFSRSDFTSGKIDRKAVAELVNFLKNHPEALPELFKQIKDLEIPEEQHAFLFFAFEKTGTPEVQKALAAALGDTGHSEMNRMRAMHALADVQTPIAESVEALISASKEFSDTTGEDPSLAATALLALGVIEKQQMNGPAKDLAQLASDELVSRMKSEISSQERSVLAEALGNTGNPKHEQLIVDQFDDENAMVRVSSARGLSSLASPNADKALLDAVTKEVQVEARKSIAEAWMMKQSSGPFDVPRLAATITQESNEGIRLALVGVLGREAATQPAAKAALISQYAREKSVTVKYKIGTFLKADDLVSTK